VTIATTDWLKTFSAEYLDEFIRDGGATVKFLVGDDNQRRAVTEGLKAEGSKRGYLVKSVDSAVTKAHLVDQFFFAVARQIEWPALVDVVRRRALDGNGYDQTGPELTIAGIAQATGVASHFVRNNIERWLSENVFHDYSMTHEFRLAMMHICLDPMNNPYQGVGGMTDVILNWLRGELKLISALKPAAIYQKIARHNARDTFVSLSHWVRFAGKAGMIVTLDISAYLTRVRAAVAPGESYYTRAATMDLYESLRQFVDSVDEMESAVVVVLAAPEFLDDNDRGLSTYRALYARVADEVRGRVRDNPVAGLIRLAAV